MKSSFFVVALACVASGPLMAQEPANANPQQRSDASGVAGYGSPSLTPEMWFYQQERNRYDDPRSAVRRKAEFRAAQRISHLEALHWMGVDPSRPNVSSTPFHYQPLVTTWGMNYNPASWRMLPNGISGTKNPF